MGYPQALPPTLDQSPVIQTPARLAYQQAGSSVTTRLATTGRHPQKALTRKTPPIRKLMCNQPMPPRDIHRPRSRLKTLGNNPSLQVIRPAPVPPPRFNNLATINTSITTVSHRHLHPITKTFWQTPQPQKWVKSMGQRRRLHRACAVEQMSATPGVALPSNRFSGVLGASSVPLKVCAQRGILQDGKICKRCASTRNEDPSCCARWVRLDRFPGDHRFFSLPILLAASAIHLFVVET